MAPFTIIIVILLLIGMSVVGVYLFFYWLRTRWINVAGKRPNERIAIISAGALVISLPYLLFKIYELHFVLSRVPEPLHVSWIEYRLERSWGVGMPGDNETGFVIYRMTARSAEWARSQGRDLGVMLPGGSTRWHQTPVNESSAHGRWHKHDIASGAQSHSANLMEYLDKYGLSIAIESGRDVEINDAIQKAGSFYSYGRGGSVTVVDPKRGKIYFAYAG